MRTAPQDALLQRVMWKYDLVAPKPGDASKLMAQVHYLLYKHYLLYTHCLLYKHFLLYKILYPNYLLYKITICRR